MKTLNLNEYGVKELSTFETKHIDGGFNPMWEDILNEVFTHLMEWLENYEEYKPLPEPNLWYSPGNNDVVRI